MIGCESDDNNNDFEAVDRDDLAGFSFDFPDPRAFGVTGQTLTLAVNQFGVNGEDDLASFTITTPTGTATGLIDVDEEGDVLDNDFIDDLDAEPECDLRVDTSTITEIPVGTVLRFGPCEVNDQTGELLVEDEDTGAVSISQAP
jgi:hypothetical protein